MKIKSVISILIAVICLLGCGSPRKASDKVPSKPIFRMITLPRALALTDKASPYVLDHYWDKFDFKDSTNLLYIDTIKGAFSDYARILSGAKKDTLRSNSVYKTLSLAEANEGMFIVFCEMFEQFFDDPNSSFRDERAYIPYLRYMIDSSKVEADYKEAFRYKLEKILKE